MTKTNLGNLIKIYEALTGVVSEMGEEAFDHFYTGGGAKLFSDFEKILESEGVKFKKSELCIRSYRHGGDTEWGVAWNTTGKPDWALTGFATSEEAADILRDRNIFKDDAVDKPRILDDVGLGIA